jgi:DNA-directed RNA polymerase subunit RPC12/RpoP
MYDFDKNKNIDIYSQGISSKQIAFFKCNTCGHEWRSSIGKRVNKDRDNSYRVVGCPKCDNRTFRKISYAEEYPELNTRFNEKLNGCTFDSLKGKYSSTTKS